MAYLKIHTGPQAGREVESDNVTSIGRMNDCDIVLSDSAASRYHARITRSEEIFLLEDQASANGTFLKGQRLQSHSLIELDDGDEIRIGSTLITFHLYRFFSSSCEMPRPSEWLNNPGSS